jgi:hypothetical protein
MVSVIFNLTSDQTVVGSNPAGGAYMGGVNEYSSPTYSHSGNVNK